MFHIQGALCHHVHELPCASSALHHWRKSCSTARTCELVQLQGGLGCQKEDMVYHGPRHVPLAAAMCHTEIRNHRLGIGTSFPRLPVQNSPSLIGPLHPQQSSSALLCWDGG